jgi:phosphatidylserine/phosphatidylglycerophosphate/cardiolipin synthase-like enzyme
MKMPTRSLWLIVSLSVGLLGALLLGRVLAAAPAAPMILIDSVHYDGNALTDADEAVRLVNVGSATVDLSGWRLSDGSSVASIQPGTILDPGAGLWLTGNAAAFRAQFGHDADLTLAPWPGFSNAGDEVILLDSAGAIVDVLVYLAGNTAQTGWSGPALEPYRVAGVFSAEGQILYRKREPQTGVPIADTNAAADWAQAMDDSVNGRKVRYPGWEGDRFFRPAAITATSTLTIAVAPDNSYDTLVRLVRNARSSIRLASLMLENAPFAGELAAAAGRGVAVTVLLEGGPPGGITDQERHACRVIEQAGGACWFMIADAARHIHDRYRYMHAKYMIIDGRTSVVGSENFSPDSLPNDDKRDGTWGRRGVFLITDAPVVADYLTTLFNDDLDADHLDLFRWTAADPVYGAPPPGYTPIAESGGISYTVRYPAPIVFLGSHAFEIVHAPENALREGDGLLGLVNRAGKGDLLLVQQLSERPYWGTTTSNPTSDPNPRLEAYIAAARRGAEVHLLLDAFFDAATSPVGNAATCDYVNRIARAEGLPLDCKVGNPTGLGIHNKMVLARIDGQGYVHVGSINGTELSSKGNRELALQVRSNEAFTYLANLFMGDTPRAIYLPLAMRHFRGTVNRLLISEIAYDTPGPDEAEFVELVNATGAPIDLTGYALGDAVLATDFEDRRFFPPGTIIAARRPLVVTLSAVAFRAQFGATPDLEIVDSDPLVPDMIDDPTWGDPEALFQLGNSGDEVVLWRRNEVIDVVTYGDGGYPGVGGCPLLVPPERTLERYPYWDDTDDCGRDFRGWPFASPGRLP